MLYVYLYMFNLLYVWQQTCTKNIYEKYLPNGSVQFGKTNTVRLAIKKYHQKYKYAVYITLSHEGGGHIHTHIYIGILWKEYIQ